MTSDSGARRQRDVPGDALQRRRRREPRSARRRHVTIGDDDAAPPGPARHCPGNRPSRRPGQDRAEADSRREEDSARAEGEAARAVGPLQRAVQARRRREGPGRQEKGLSAAQKGDPGSGKRVKIKVSSRRGRARVRKAMKHGKAKVVLLVSAVDAAATRPTRPAGSPSSARSRPSPDQGRSSNSSASGSGRAIVNGAGRPLRTRNEPLRAA